MTDSNAFPSEGLLEIKCPWKHRHCTVKDACKNPSFYCELQSDVPCLKIDHFYHYQVQGQLAITGRSWCDFAVYTTQDFHIQRIYLDREFWSSVEERLVEFYLSCVLPEFVHTQGVNKIRSLLC